jgi:hypothetical protein
VGHTPKAVGLEHVLDSGQKSIQHAEQIEYATAKLDLPLTQQQAEAIAARIAIRFLGYSDPGVPGGFVQPRYSLVQLVIRQAGDDVCRSIEISLVEHPEATEKRWCTGLVGVGGRLRLRQCSRRWLNQRVRLLLPQRKNRLTGGMTNEIGVIRCGLG